MRIPTGKRLSQKLGASLLLVSALGSVSQPLACAQGTGVFNAGPLAQGTGGNFGNIPNIQRTDITPQGGTILPTDVLPLPTIQNRMTVGENFQLRMLQKLPARFYMNASCETSFRYETNPFQFPTKRKLISQIPQANPNIFRLLSAQQQGQILDLIGFVGNDDVIFRCLPNVTAGITVTPRTRVFANYFMIRDSLFNIIRLNTVIHSIAYGVQQDIPLGSRANLQAEMQFRELYQLHQQPVFDFLPGLTVSYVATPRTVLFANALLQMRGKRYFQAPTKEIDPFYTWGVLHQRNGWTFSASTTFVQNFREPFRGNATIPVNNYAFISDFEIARRLLKQFPGLQAFVRAEPIWNFHSHNRPGLAGMDFRLFWGMRLAMSKPSLSVTLDQLRQQLEEQEVQPPGSTPPASPTKPSAFVEPHEVIASSAQPMHGYLPETVAPPALAGSEPERKNIIDPPHLTARTLQDLPAELEKPLEIAKSDVAKSEVTKLEEKTDSLKSDEKRPEEKTPAKIASEPSIKQSFNMVVIPPFPAVQPVKGEPVDSASLRPAVLYSAR